MDMENPAIIDKDIGEEKKGKKKEGSSRGFKKDFVYHLHPALLWKNKLCAEICMRGKHHVECNVKTDVESDAEVGWLCMAQTKPSARLTNLFQRHCRRNDSSTRGGDGLCTALGNSRQRPSPTLGLLPSSSFILLFISHPFPLLCPSSFVSCFTIVETCFSSRGKIFFYIFFFQFFTSKSILAHSCPTGGLELLASQTVFKTFIRKFLNKLKTIKSLLQKKNHCLHRHYDNI